MKIKQKKSCNLVILQSCNYSRGQSLVEIIVAVGVGAILIGGTVGILTPVLRSNTETKNVQFATSLAQQYLDSLRNISEESWLNIYNLSKGNGNKYILVASSTRNIVVAGEEGVFDNDVFSGLVGNWKFDEVTGATAYDFSGYGNHGALVSNPTRVSSSNCKLGECLGFDSTNRVDIIKSSSLAFTTAFTVSAWVKPTDCAHGASGHNTVVAQESGLLLAFNNSCQVANYVNTGDVWKGPDGGGKTIPTGEWSHLTMVWNGSNILSYFNGALISGSGVPASGSWTNSAYNYYIAVRPDFGGIQTFNGSIDDVRIYNRALSASEVNQLYQDRDFVRYFYVENVSRELCGVGDITSEATTTCSSGAGSAGAANDPSTQKITVSISWPQGGLVSKTEYLTRTRNNVFVQTDWSGGAGQEGPITSANNQFSSSTRVDYSTSTGSIRMQGL